MSSSVLPPRAGNRNRISSLAPPPVTDAPCAAWSEDGLFAAVVMANTSDSASSEPRPMQLLLPDGRELIAAAATAGIRFERRGETWVPIHLSAVRVRFVSLDGQCLFHSSELAGQVDLTLGAPEPPS